MKLELGKDLFTCETGVSVSKPVTIEDRVTALEQQITRILKLLGRLDESKVKEVAQESDSVPRDKIGIPIGTVLLGYSSKVGHRVLTVKDDGYYISNRKFNSLSAAAEDVSGVRRSGKTFWRLPNGMTVKEEYG